MLVDYTQVHQEFIEMPTRERERGPELLLFFPPWRLLFIFLSFFSLLALFCPSHCIFEEYFPFPVFTYIAKNIKVLFNTFFSNLDFLIQLLMPQGHCELSILFTNLIFHSPNLPSVILNLNPQMPQSPSQFPSKRPKAMMHTPCLHKVN